MRARYYRISEIGTAFVSARDPLIALAQVYTTTAPGPMRGPCSLTPTDLRLGCLLKGFAWETQGQPTFNILLSTKTLLVLFIEELSVLGSMMSRP